MRKHLTILNLETKGMLCSRISSALVIGLGRHRNYTGSSSFPFLTGGEEQPSPKFWTGTYFAT